MRMTAACLFSIALLILVGAGRVDAQPGRLAAFWASPCTLDVVLVAFKDTTARHRGTTPSRNDSDFYNYYEHDLPHGYTIPNGVLTPGTSSYTMDDFERLFSGGYYYSVNEEEEPLVLIPDYTGTPTVADSDTLPEVFGSLRHYFHEVSDGDFELHVRILNLERRNYPVWVQLPQTKGHYAERARGTAFWLDAEGAMRDSVRVWGLDTTVYDPPDDTYSPARRLQRKVLYLYAGAEYSDRAVPALSLIHPRADGISNARRIAFRYVAGERQGSGSNSHQADRLTAIGIHVHEIGHLLGFVHPSEVIGSASRRGRWAGQNPYSLETATCGGRSFGQGRLVGWGNMQSGDGGPPVEGRGNSKKTYKYAHRSCPNPFNPIYMRDLNWGTWETITVSEEDKTIQPDRYYFIEGADNSEYVLEFRTAQGFGRYASWYRFEHAPGLLIWKRYHFVNSRGRPDMLWPRLIPADGRAIYDASNDGGFTPRTWNSSFPWPWIDRLSDPFGALEGNGLRATFESLPTHPSGTGLPTEVALDSLHLRPVVTQATDDSHFRHGLCGDPVHTPSRLAIRNMRVNRRGATGDAVVNVYTNYWTGEIVTNTTWTGHVYVGGDVTVRDGVVLTINENAQVRFLTPESDDDANGISELIVDATGSLVVEGGVTFRAALASPGAGVARARPESLGVRVLRGIPGRMQVRLDGLTLGAGSHFWSGQFTVAGDLTVTDTLAVAAGSEILFAAGDATNSGDRSRTELTVASGGRLTAREVVFRGAAAAPPWWYGIYVAENGRADLTGATVRDGLRCVGGPGSVTPPTRMTVGPCAPPPEAPGDLTATPDDGQISLSWTAAETHEALPVLGYRVRHYRAEAAPAEMREAKWKGVPGGGSARDTTLAGLDNGTAYLFRVLAENAAGAGGPRAEVTATPLGPPVNLRAEAGDGQVTLRWDDPSPANSTIAQWQYCRKPAGAAACEADAWQTEASASARQAVVSDLKHGQAHEFEVRAVNTADQAGPAASAAAVLHEVTFNSTGYVLIEGGEPLAGQPGRDRVKVMVLLTPAPPSAPGVAIPLTVGAGTAAEDDYAEEDDYEVGPPAFNSSRVLTFPRNQTSRSFTLSVKADADTIHETVLLGFGDLPAGVRTGARPSATVTLYDTPNAPTNVRAEPGHETVTLRWDDPDHGSIRGWQYRKRLAGPGNDWEDWAAAGSGATRTEYPVPNLTNGLKYMFKVRAFNTRGYGAASATVEATPSGLQATPYNGAAGLAWVDPEITALAGWRSRHRPVLRGGKWSPFTQHGAGAGTHVVGNLTNDQKYRFEVQGLNAAGEVLDRETCEWGGGRPCTWQAVATPKATLPDPPPPPCRLSLTGPADTTYAEHGTGWVGVYTPGRSESCDESLALTWTRRGADADAFTVSGDTLYFAAEPDYEQPVDAGGDNAYDLQVWIRAGSDSTHAPVQVRVTNIEEPGRVALSGTLSLSETDTVAAVGTELTASLSDADGVRPEAIAWEWHRWSLTATPPGWQPLDGEDASTYTPSRSVLGARLRVRATYTDGHGPGKSAQNTSIDRVVDVPDAPGDLSPSAGDASVTLSWDGAISNGAAIRRYEHRRLPNEQGDAQWTAWVEVPVEEEDQARDARSVVVPSLTNKTEYTFEVRAVNGVGPGVAADTTATPRMLVLTVQGPSDTTFAEGQTGEVARYWVADGGGQRVTPDRWETLAGADRGKLSLAAAGTDSAALSFKTAPDYEVPADANRDTVYEVTVQARQGQLRSVPHPVRVRVTNEDDPGLITFAPATPKVGGTVHATLADEDGGAGIVASKVIEDSEEGHGWHWTPSDAPDPCPPPSGASGAVSLLRDCYKVPAAAAGRRVRVLVRYDDAHGPDKTAVDRTGVVQAIPPGPPEEVETDPGDERVALTWTEAEPNGAAVDRYEHRHRISSTLSWNEDRAWQTAPGGGAARTDTVKTLGNGTSYTFQIRAHNAKGYGDTVEVTATPATVPDPPDLSAEPGDRQVALTWTEAADNGAEVDLYEMRYRSRSSWTGRDWHPVDGEGAARDTTVTGLSPDTTYTFQVRAHNRVGYGEPDSVAAAPANQKPVCTGPETKRLAENGSRQIGTYTCTDPGGVITWILKGAQADSLRLTALSPPQATQRNLVFRNVPNYELRRQPYEALVIGRGRGGLSDTVEVTVTVTNGPDDGEVTLDNTSPRVAEWITAELVDEDGGVENTLWTWPRTTPGGASDDGAQGQADASHRHYVPLRALGKQLQARVNYDDDYAEENTAISDKTQPVRANVPGAPLSLRSSPGHRQVRLSWNPAATRGAAVDSYQVRVDEGRWSTVPGLGAARNTTITRADGTPLVNGTSYTFEVRAHNDVGAGEAASVTAAPENQDPKCTGPETPSLAENGSKAIGTYTCTDDPGDAITWLLRGPQASSFVLAQASPAQASKRQLNLRSVPDFEARSSYRVWVIGRDSGELADTVKVTVTITDVNERPNVSGATAPSVPERTKSVATYTGTDPDAGDALTWSLAGTDAALFEHEEVTSQPTKRKVQFKSNPHFTRSNASANTKVVEVVATDPDGLSDRETVTVTITDADDPGLVSVTPSSPKVGQTVTAILTDSDQGISDTSWAWLPNHDTGASGQSFQRRSKRDVVEADVGKRIQATVSYDDNHGEGKSATGSTTNAVRAIPPCAPSLRVSAGDARATLTWTPPSCTGGAAIDRYEYRYRSGSSWTGRNWHTVAGGGDARTVTVSSLTNGTSYTFQVRAHNSQGYGEPDTEAATPAGEPDTPDLTATAGYRQVKLTWTAAASNGADVDRYEYRYRSGSSWTGRNWITVASTARTATVSSLTNGTTYTFQLRAHNREGYSAADTETATPRNRGPSVSGSGSPSVVEGTKPVDTYTASDPDAGDVLTWSLADTDASHFELKTPAVMPGSRRELHFKSAPNFEARSSYSVRVRVRDREAAADSVEVDVSVTNADDPGVVTLDPGRPKVGEHVTATLTDEDGGITGPTWSWSTESGAAGQASSVQSFRYTVPASDVGRRLEASVGYTDNHGSGKSASGRSTGTVRANTPKAPPGFDAVRGNAQVALSWGAADGRGAAVDRYDIRGAGSGWTAVPGGGSARDTTVTGLTNGTSYAFEVRAHNSAGDGAASSDSATPATVPGAPTGLATSRGPESGKATISWEAAPDNGSPIKRYQYRRRIGTTGTWRGWFTVSGGGAARSRTVTGLGDFTSYTWEVRAENEVGFGPAASIFQERLGPRGTAGDAEGDNIGDNEGEPDTPMEDESDDTATAKPVAGGLAGPAALHVTTAPNPFNSSTTLHFQLPEASPVTLTVYNVAGQVVAELARGEVLEAGLHEREWYGTDDHGRAAASGLYLYRLIAAEGVRVGKLALIR